MISENRPTVRHGINPGLGTLQEVSGKNGTVTELDVSYRIGPRLMP